MVMELWVLWLLTLTGANLSPLEAGANGSGVGSRETVVGALQ